MSKKYIFILIGIITFSFLLFLSRKNSLEQLDTKDTPSEEVLAHQKEGQPESIVKIAERSIVASRENATASDLEDYLPMQDIPEEHRDAFLNALAASGYDLETDLPIEIQPLSATNLRSSRGYPLQKLIPSPIFKRFEDDAEAAKEFSKNLKEREQAYPTIEPKPEMISVAQAVEIAKKASPAEFDDNQRPEVNLIRDFFLVTLWEHRRPHFPATIHVANIMVNAYSGEVLSVQVQPDLIQKPVIED